MTAKRKTALWTTIAVAYALLVAPNAMVIRIALQDHNIYYWSALRYLMVAIVCLPFIIKYWRRFWNRKALKWVVGSAISMTIAILSYAGAIQLSQASYVSIITLTTPVFLVILSHRFTKDRLSKRAIIGITLAAIGAALIAILPTATIRGGDELYSSAALLALINSISFSFAIIALRRANEYGVSLTASIGVYSLLTTFVSFILFMATSGDNIALPTDINFWAATIYTGIGVGLLARMLSVRIFEKNGAAFMGAITYLETLLSALLPIAILRERISFEMLIGGLLIVGGVYIIKSHPHKHIKFPFIGLHH